jgi:hypothetical protein
MDSARDLPQTLKTGRAIKRNMGRVVALAFAAIALLFTLFATSALAFTIQDGTAAQRALVTKTIKACALPYTATDAELRFMGPVKVIFAPMAGISGYSEMGRLFVNSSLTGDSLSELVAHEWAHQIWYTLGPKWWAKWADQCNAASGSVGGAWQDDPRENFAECAKVALWGSEYLRRDYAVTDLKVTGPQELRQWLVTARYVNKCPFVDLSPTAMWTTSDQDELAAAGGYVNAEGIMEGYNSTSFGATQPLTRRQLFQICQRAGLSCPESWADDYGATTRGDVRDTVAGLDWTGERWSEPLTRGQMARLVWRSR